MKKTLLSFISLFVFLVASTSVFAAGSSAVKKIKPGAGKSASAYTVDVTNAAGCTASISAPVTICKGSCSTITFTSLPSGMNPYRYQWSCSNAGSGSCTGDVTGNSNTYSISVCPTVTTTYTVTVTPGYGTTNTCNPAPTAVSTVVTVQPQITVAPTASPAAVCPGATSTITCGVSPAGTYTYNWSTTPSNAQISGTGCTITGTYNVTGASIQYCVTVTDNSTAACTASGCVTVNRKNVTAALPGNTSICAGGSSALTVTTTGVTGTPTYTWASNPVYASAFTPAAGNSQTVTATPTGTTTYTVTVNDGTTCTATAQTVISVGSLTVSISGNGQVCANAGSCTPLTANPSGTYVWSASSGGSPGSTQTVSVCPTAQTTYIVTVTDAAGCSNTASKVVAISPKPIPNPGNPSTFCPPMTGYVLGGTPSGTTPGSTPTGSGGSGSGYSYVWTAVPASTFTPNNTDPNPSVSPTATTVYTVVVTDGNGCSDSKTVTITRKDVTATLAANPNPICPGQTTTLTVTPTGVTGTPTYTWAGSPTNPSTTTTTTATNTVNPSVQSTYTVTVNDGGCTGTASTVVTMSSITAGLSANPAAVCPGASTTLTATPAGGTYQWASSSLPNPTPGAGGTATANPTTQTTYTVTVTNASGCIGTASTVVTMNSITATLSSNPSSVCPGSTTTLTATPGGGTYQWASSSLPNPTPGAGGTATANPTIQTTYTVTVTSAAGCSATANTVVNMNSTSATLTPSPLNICPGGSSTLTPTPSGTFVWSSTCGALANSTAPITVSPSVTCTYNVTVTDVGGCTATANAVVTVDPVPSPSFAPQQVCPGACATLTDVGTGGVTYNWSGSISGNPANACPPATTTYTVTVSSAAGCSATTSVVVTVNPTPTATAKPGASNCLGSCFTLGGAPTASGGSGTGYTYNWTTPSPAGTYAPSNAVANPTVCPATAGNFTYVVTVTDSKGCTATDDVTITVTPPPVADAGPAKYLCYNENHTLGGSPTATGTAPFTYNWSPGLNNLATATSSNPTITGTISTSYAVTVTDGAGCSATSSVNISVNSQMAATGTYTSATCGGNDGSVQAFPTGGSSPYSYLWTGTVLGNSPTSQTMNNVPTGNYNCVITDSKGCTTTLAVFVPSIGGPTATATVTNATCKGSSNGSATITATAGAGGSGVFTYVFDSGTPSGNSVSGLAAGAHTATVTDASSPGCPVIVNFNITEPAQIVVTTTNGSVTCSGACDGQVSVSATGGSGSGYTYSWSNAATTTSLNSLCSGTYTVTVSDQADATCQATGSASVTSPTTVTASATVTQNISCATLCDGIGSASASGGTPPYNYNWPSNTGATSTGLCSGTYIATVTDNNGCNATASITITEPTPISLTISSTPANCGQSNGTSTVVASGGTPSYSYLWSNSPASTTSSMSGAGGSYCVTVTDNNGCTAGTCNAIANVGAPTLVVTSANPVSQNGLCDGFAVFTASSGAGAPYTFVWDSAKVGTLNGAQDQSTATGLCVGQYCVTVTSNANPTCPQTNCATITGPPPLGLNLSKVDPKCFGGNNGTVTITVTNPGSGSPYNWAIGNPAVVNSGSFSTPPNTFTISNLSAGTYTVTLTDNGGATKTASITLGQPTQVIASPTVTQHVSCNGQSTGSLCANASGGTPGYTYTWSGSLLGSCPSNVPAGSYNVTVTDFNGCTTTAPATITQPTALNPTLNPSPATCYNRCDGSVSLNVSGGVGPYSANWSPGNCAGVSSGLNINPVRQGNYTVLVTDKNGCTASKSTTVGGPATGLIANAYRIGFGSSNPSCSYKCDGIVSATWSGVSASPNPTYSWSTIPVKVQRTITTACAGFYTVTVNDGSCTATDTITLQAPPAIVFTATPTDPLCYNGTNGSITLNVTNANPTPTYTWSPNVGSVSGNTISGLDAMTTSKTYTITVTDGTNCTASTSAVLSNPASMSVTSTVNKNVSCYNGNDGAATINASGGTGSLSYVWSPGGSGSNSTNLTSTGSGAPGQLYSVTVSDANSCSTVTTFNITQPPQLTEVKASVNANCFGANNGSASVTPSGGSPGYTVVWSVAGSSFFTGNSVTNLAGTTSGTQYDYVVTDANGCTVTNSVTITQPSQLTAPAITQAMTKCYGSSDASLTVSPSGSSNSYNYAWSPAPASGNTPTVNNLPVGTYTVTVSDQGNSTCSISKIGTVTQPAAIGVTVTANDICPNVQGDLTVSTSGGTFGSNSAITSWSNSYSNASYNPITGKFTPASQTYKTAGVISQAGPITYTVVVSDDNGCTGSGTGGFTVKPLLGIVNSPAALIPEICASPNPATSVNVTATSNMLADYTWSMTTPSGTQSFPMQSGTQNSMISPSISDKSGPVIFSVTVTDNLCTTLTSNVSIKIMNIPDATIDPITPGCSPHPVAPLSFTPNPIAAADYSASFVPQWKINHTVINPSAPGTYNYEGGTDNFALGVGNYPVELVVTGTLNGGQVCVSNKITSSFDVYQLPEPVIYALSELVTDMRPEAEFQLDRTNNARLSQSTVTWSFGDGGSDAGKFEVMHTYKNSGSYPVIATVKSIYGCPGADTIMQVVRPETQFWIPDAFTPNGDGSNDKFLVKGVNVKEFEMYIFDRWGNMISKSFDINEGWDGTANNGAERAQNDVYVYKVIVTDFMGKRLKPFVGRVTLIR